MPRVRLVAHLLSIGLTGRTDRLPMPRVSRTRCQADVPKAVQERLTRGGDTRPQATRYGSRGGDGMTANFREEFIKRFGDMMNDDGHLTGYQVGDSLYLQDPDNFDAWIEGKAVNVGDHQ